MSKKHFEALAAMFKESMPHQHGLEKDMYTQWRHDAYNVAAVCARFNPNFDRAHFLAACGVEG